uniref:Uncharacterized protein n=1 Tax=Candidatus Phytoplasma australasiaticum subsp. australasiaticum TaxID=2832407 RepID=A0A7S7FZA2_9MOLU|nr:hypothetical protein H7685_02465 ['Parthenium hysterophorus' phyllody phytoplasma]
MVNYDFYNYIYFNINISSAFFKRKLQQFSQQIRQKINYINLLMHKIHESIGIRYPSIYYELQKLIILYYLISLNYVL